MRTVGLIPARGGSKRLPGKNVRYIAGKPLIYWTIEAALRSGLNEVIVSTEDEDIREIVRDSVRVIDRPAILADDLAPSDAVIKHALECVEADRVMLLQPTSPLRTTYHINEALKLGSTVSVYWDGACYKRNGAIYLMYAHRPMEFTTCYVMDKRDSVDIDTIEDFHMAEAYLETRR